MLTPILIYAGFLPLGVAAAVAFVAQRSGVSRQATWAWGVAAGFVAAEVGVRGIGRIAHPIDVGDWLPFLVLLALGASLVLFATQGTTRWLALALAALLVVAMPLRLMSCDALRRTEWSTTQKLLCIGLLAAVFGLQWLLLAIDEDDQPAIGQTLFVVVTAVGAAIVLTLSGVLAHGQICGAVGAAVVGTACGGLLGSTGAARADRRFGLRAFTGAAGVVSCALVGLLILGRFFSDVSTANSLLILVALTAAGAPLPAVVRRQAGWMQLALRGAICLAPLAFAVANVVMSREGAAQSNPYSASPASRGVLAPEFKVCTSLCVAPPKPSGSGTSRLAELASKAHPRNNHGGFQRVFKNAGNF